MSSPARMTATQKRALAVSGLMRSSTRARANAADAPTPTPTPRQLTLSSQTPNPQNNKNSTPDDLHTPYVFPQENGGRADVRWLALGTPLPSSSPSLAFVCAGAEPPPLSSAAAAISLGPDPDGDGGLSGTPHSLALASVSRHSALELHAARHQHELPGFSSSGGAAVERGATATATTPSRTDVVHVHLDAAHMGVGGDDSWSPTVHDPYLLPPGRYRFGVALVLGNGSSGGDDGEGQRRRLTALHHALARRWVGGGGGRLAAGEKQQ